MSNVKRRDLVKTLGFLAPAAALLGSTVPPANAQGSKGPLDEDKVQGIIASVKPAVVMLEVEHDNGIVWGSGFFVSNDGLLVTNRHVVKDAQKITCIYKNRTRLIARTVKIDAQYDLAIVRVEVKEPVPTVQLGDSDAVAEGVLVAATGYPAPRDMVWLGMALDSSTSRGAVNGLRYGGDANTYLGDRTLQIDAPVTHGNSGGPVTRLDTGEVIGIVTAGMQSDNLTFAVPINQAKVLLAGIGAQAKPSLAAPGSKEAAVEPGDLRMLNTIGVSKELPRLFGFGFPFARNFAANSQPVREWYFATGQAPAHVTPLVIDGDDLYFGATDGKLRRWRLDSMAEPPVVLLDVDEESIFLYAPAVTKDVVVAAAGSLDLSQRWEQRATVGSVLGLLAGVGPGTETKKITRIEGEGSLVGLNRRNGNIDWAVETGWIGTPVIFENNVYYGGVGERGSVDAFQGKARWSFEKKKGPQAEFFHVGHASQRGVFGLAIPIEGKRDEASGEPTILGDGKARLESYNAADGKVLWKVELGNVKDRPRAMGVAMFVDEQKNVAYALAAQIVAAVDLNNKKLLWSYDHGKAMEEAAKKNKGKKFRAVNFTPQLAIHDGIIYIGSEDRKLYAFNGEDGKILWTYNTRGRVGHPVYYEGQVIVGSTDGYVHVVDAKTGSLNWRVQTDGPVTSQPQVHRGMVFVPTGDGSIQTVRVPLA